MAVAVGIDVSKEFHWAEIKIAESGKVLLSRRFDNTPGAIGELIEQIAAAQASHGPATVGIDVLGGIAGLLEAMLLHADLAVVHVPGMAVNRARRATVGGERKSDPKDARVIADQVRMRDDLRAVRPGRQIDAELRLLVGRRAELVTDATRRAARLRDLLVSIHPGLERVVDVTGKLSLHLLTCFVTPAEIRAAGVQGVLAHLRQVRHVKRGGAARRRTARRPNAARACGVGAGLGRRRDREPPTAPPRALLDRWPPHRGRTAACFLRLRRSAYDLPP